MTGSHSVNTAGQGTERLTETRPYHFGDDPLSIDSIRSLQNAMKHNDPAGQITITEEDLEVFETEHNSSCATVVMIDISHSMILYGEDRITPAKKVALALTELILTKYPKDAIDVLLFGDDAREVPISEIPYVPVGPYHTNTKAGLQLAQQILRRRKHSNKQIFMITDGKPSALTENGRLYTNSFGLDMKIVNRTLEEADRCRRANIPITTFMLATDPMLVNFVEQLSKINRGRAFYSSPDRLGEYILADYIRNRRKFVH
jgi:Ca-activated chloride channel homolog